jgi:hypothetical protein
VLIFTRLWKHDGRDRQIAKISREDETERPLSTAYFCFFILVSIIIKIPYEYESALSEERAVFES